MALEIEGELVMRIFILTTVLAFWTAPAPAAGARPNILLILGDDLGWSDLGCYGGEIRTPNLDALAKGGLRFTQFYNCARCCPTRASLLTGLYPHQAGVGDMDGDRKRPGYRGFLQPNCVTVAEVLKSAGYRTYMAGKWHLTTKSGPIRRGFDEFYGMIGGFNSCFQENPFFTRRPDDRPRRKYPAGAFYSTDVFGDYALDFLADARKSGDKPFFLYLAFNAAHFPLHAHKEDIGRYKDVYAKGWDKIREERYARQKKMGLIDPRWPLTPRSGFETRRDFFRKGDNPAWDSLDADRRADLARRMAVYAAMVDRMDRNIGRVVADLRAHGQLDNTLIFFLSDNGACAEWDPFGFDGNSGPKNILHRGADLERMGGPDSYHSYGSGWANACNTPFRLYKHWTHEGGISTPLIVHWPSGVKDRGKVRSQVGHVLDIMTTCVDVSGAKYPQRVGANAITPAEGTSLTPAFADRPLERQFLAWEHEGNKAIRAGHWKAAATHDGRWELYDMQSDRVELHDLAERHPDKVKELSVKWESWAKRTNVLSNASRRK
jgi:arylsulfatase A-like enzyme